MKKKHRQKGAGGLGQWSGFADPSYEPSGTRPEGLQAAVDARTIPVPSGLEIHVLEGEDAGKTFAMETCEVVLGRRMKPEESKEGWIFFNEPTVSRMHAVLEWRAGARRYRLIHHSRTNPTLVNGRLVQQTVLYTDDLVRLGDLTFQLRAQRPRLNDDAPAQIEDKGQFYSGFKTLVTSGPDQGRQFVLGHKVVHVGGPEAQASGDNWIVLSDKELPREQAFFVWYDVDKKYGIFHAGASPVPTQISRVVTEPAADASKRNLLDVDDCIIVGQTRLTMLRHELFHETVKAMKAQPGQPAGRKPPPPFAPPTESEEKLRAVVDITPSDPSPLIERDEDVSPGDTEPQRGDQKVSRIPIAKRSAVLARTPTALALTGVPPPPRARESGPQKRAFDATNNWFGQPDYGLEIIDGPARGRRIALMSGALRAERELLLGRPGRRLNDIEIPDDGIDNEQARLRYEHGRFTFVNQAKDSVRVNEQELQPGFGHLLKNGDEIEMGQTVLLFIDRGALQRQFQFEIEVLSENGRSDISRHIILNQDTVTIGRSKKANIRVDDPNVSRVHAQVAFRRGGFVLRHKSETNPTFVNGVSMDHGQERFLQSEDEIHLSEGTILLFRRRPARQSPR